ncbi:MAG TPA: hypothetical protein VGY99_03000 [Candidatus Binataceae bacterium]|jgi:hypothetical protein|nr:hypothetical protein [Candidatus Binataceae bacterium]
MGYADDISRLRQEIDKMHGARIELRGRLHRYADLRRNMNEQRSEMRRHNAEEASRTRTAMTSFVSNMRQMMRETMSGSEHERHAAHSAWMRMPMARRHKRD